ncbi:MAG: methylmalonyl-CoA epimerase [Planctomycetes bacterium]|nr:methylmalonyl-CoA epimerase [Planctomycetota bacterium]
MNIRKIEHLGIAVRSAAEAEKLYAEALGLSVVARETLDEMKLRVVKVASGETVLELLEPLEGETVIRKFLAERGPGIHHICFEVDDVAAATEELKRKGYSTVWEEPHLGAGGRRVNFLRPKECGGVLIELNEPARGVTS